MFESVNGSLRRPRRLTMADEAYEAIVEAIVDERLAPGTHLTVRSLATELDMSTTPIREALNRAAGQRLVVQFTNRGCRVAPLLTLAGYHQIFWVRRVLEQHAMTAAKPDAVSISRVRDLAQVMPHMEHGDHYSDFHDFNQADHEFHLTLVRMAGNPFLEQAWSDLHFHIHVGRLYAGVGIVDFSEALREHTAIAEALGVGDLASAAGLAEQHITQAEHRLLKLVPPFKVADVSMGEER